MRLVDTVPENESCRFLRILLEAFCIVSTEIPAWSFKVFHLRIDAEPLVENLNFLGRCIALCKQVDGFSSLVDCLVHDNDRMTGMTTIDNHVTNLQFLAGDGG